MRPPRALPIVVLLGALAVCAAGAPAAAEDGERGDDQRERGQTAGDPGAGIDALLEQSASELATHAAVRRALDWLAARQAEERDGSFPPVGAEAHAPIATAALGALAFMAGGSTPGRGPHGAELALAVDYLLSKVDRAPESAHLGFVHDERDQRSQMHGHGFATLALAEAYAVSPRSPRGKRLAEALELAVARIERSQGVEGGWYYQPVRVLSHEGSVTICLVQALRAAKNAGVNVDRAVIARALDYVQRSQMENGAFRYALGDDTTSVALTAAAISTLNATGKYAGAGIASGYDYLRRELGARELERERRSSVGAARYPHYERLYLAQALWHHADPAVFGRWYEGERKRLLLTQRGDGSWGDSAYGDCYATAVNALVLALPDGLLPIFQR